MPLSFSISSGDDGRQDGGFDLVRPCDVRGVLHAHSRYTDGAHDLEDLVFTARAIGLEYLGVSDHLLSDSHQEGLDRDAIRRQREELDLLREENPGFEILQGLEVEADSRGRLPGPPDLLRGFDYLIVSFEGESRQGEDLTARMLQALDDPRTTILGKPIGDYMLRRGPVPMDVPRVLGRAAAEGVAVEIDANPGSLELDWDVCRRAQELGVMMVINPNAHRAARLVDFRHGVELARSAGICCRTILNTYSVTELRKILRGS